MECIAVTYGESVLAENHIFENGNSNNSRHINFTVYLIKDDGHLILVDAGCETMPGFEIKNFVGSIKALEMAGYSPEDITDVVITHSHHDHIECVKYFKNAVIHIQKDEYECGKGYIPQSFKINLFDEKYKINKDIEIVKIGGHSIGSCIVEFMMSGKTYIIAGDECYSRECLNKRIITGVSYNRDKSKKFIKKFSNKKYTVLLCHD